MKDNLDLKYLPTVGYIIKCAAATTFMESESLRKDIISFINIMNIIVFIDIQKRSTVFQKDSDQDDTYSTKYISATAFLK
jgi:hypothetical protein